MTDGPVAIFKRGKGRPTTARKRSASPGSSSAPGGPSTSTNTTSTNADVVVRPTKKGAANILSSGTKRTASEREREDDAVDVHWATSGAQSVSSSALEILAGDEAEEMMAKRQRRAAPEDEDDAFANDGQYHGMKAYGNKIKKQQEVAKTMRVGPVRMASSTIRTATIVDYQPDVCKDYKETGYCGFGDSCKFLHDRGTYLSGWQIDKKWDELQRNKGGRGGAEESSSSDSDEDIPFACLICRKPYTDPVVTRCGHYFCSACAIKRFAKTPKCIACGAPTNGIFNRADKVIERMKKVQTDKDAPGDEDGDGGEGGVPVEGLDAASDDE